MIIIHGVNKYTLPRFVSRSLQDCLQVMPAMVVTGARQTGKSTLVQDLTPGERRYFALDDLDAARLRTFRAEYGDKARSGLLLHTGTTLEWLTPDVLAAPWSKVP